MTKFSRVIAYVLFFMQKFKKPGVRNLGFFMSRIDGTGLVRLEVRIPKRYKLDLCQQRTNRLHLAGVQMALFTLRGLP